MGQRIQERVAVILAQIGTVRQAPVLDPHAGDIPQCGAVRGGRLDALEEHLPHPRAAEHRHQLGQRRRLGADDQPHRPGPEQLHEAPHHVGRQRRAQHQRRMDPLARRQRGEQLPAPVEGLGRQQQVEILPHRIDHQPHRQAMRLAGLQRVPHRGRHHPHRLHHRLHLAFRAQHLRQVAQGQHLLLFAMEIGEVHGLRLQQSRLREGR